MLNKEEQERMEENDRALKRDLEMADVLIRGGPVVTMNATILMLG